MADERLYVTFGPVQGFVGQARRTRDFWAGSYILSYLSGVSMASCIKSGGEIESPVVTDDYLLKSILDGRLVHEQVKTVGSLPNRFTVKGDNLVEMGKQANEDFMAAWRNIAEAVFSLIDTLGTEDTRGMWNRQIENFWELYWLVSSNSRDIDSRKNWRTFSAGTEPGEKCTVCGEREALSPKAGANRREVREFWQELSNSVQKETDKVSFYGDGRERLCGVCTVKRLFPLVSKKALAWSVSTNYPSTIDLAVVDWFKAKESNTQTIETYIREVSSGPFGKGISPNWQYQNGDPFDLDLGIFFEDYITKDNYPFASDKDIEDQRMRVRSLGRGPSPFYSLLLMDGDKIGDIHSKYPEKSHGISKALAAFNQDLPDVVSGYMGRLVYAGGDDLLALLPVSTAIECAADVRAVFKKHFTAFGIPEASISAAIIYAHYMIPLRDIIKDSHRLLDDVAKDQTGRDAFAIRVWKRGGKDYTFAKLWGEDESNAREIMQLVRAVRDREYSTGFLYSIRETLKVTQDESLESLSFTDQLELDIFTAAYLRNRELKEINVEAAQEKVKRLLDFSRAQKRVVDEDEVQVMDLQIQSSGPILLRFLAQKGVY